MGGARQRLSDRRLIRGSPHQPVGGNLPARGVDLGSRIAHHAQGMQQAQQAANLMMGGSGMMSGMNPMQQQQIMMQQYQQQQQSVMRNCMEGRGYSVLN